ncbi:MAG: hypothetical protein GKR90_00005 [Pseudomonadales bacterium]|nr:hypothetical protein [Pseudomonadales bacterium]
MKMIKIFCGVFLVYVGLVALLPGIVGYWQPDWPGGVQITTTDSAGNEGERVLAVYRFNDKLYVCSNYWLRGWYNQALENPDIEALVDGERKAYTAIPVQGAKHDQLLTKYTQGFIYDVLYGFAPRKFLRLDPR